MKLHLENDYISMSDYCNPCNNCFSHVQGYVSLSCNSNIVYAETDQQIFCRSKPQLLLTPEPVNTTIPNCVINTEMQFLIKTSKHGVHADLFYHKRYLYDDSPFTFLSFAVMIIVFHTLIKYLRVLCMSRRLRLQEQSLEANYAPIVNVDKESEVCTICIEEFQEDEKVRKLNCGHEFHVTCIDEWKKRGNRTCPNCNIDFMQNNNV